jgi:protein gp37
LTKNPKRYLDFELPKNLWIGATADTQKRMDETLEVFSQLKNKNIKFISCEPFLEKMSFTREARFVDWIILGGKRGPGEDAKSAQQPEWRWVYRLLVDAWDNQCLVYFKPNLTVVPKECP